MVGVFSFLFVVSIVALVVAVVRLVISAVKKESKKPSAVMAAVSVVLLLVSFVGVGLTYHPTPEQIAERERIAAEKAAEKEERERQKAEEKAEQERLAEEAARKEAEEVAHAESSAPSESQTPEPEPTPSESEPVTAPPVSESVTPPAPAESKEFEVSLNASVVENNGKPVFTIDTNLPNETKLMLTLSRDDYTAQTHVTVKDGVASSEEFSDKGSSLVSGEYLLTVSMSIPKLQPDVVREVIGENGENMSGKYVLGSEIGDSVYVRGDFDFSLTGSAESEPDFIEEHRTDIVVASKMTLDNFVTNYKIPLDTQLWTIAKFDGDGAIAAMADVKDKSTDITVTAIVVLTPVMEDGKMAGATPHFVSVGDVIYGDDGYCDDVFSILAGIGSSR